MAPTLITYYYLHYFTNFAKHDARDVQLPFPECQDISRASPRIEFEIERHLFRPESSGQFSVSTQDLCKIGADVHFSIFIACEGSPELTRSSFGIDESAHRDPIPKVTMSIFNKKIRFFWQYLFSSIPDYAKYKRIEHFNLFRPNQSIQTVP